MSKITKSESFLQDFFGIFEELCNKHKGLAQWRVKVKLEVSAFYSAKANYIDFFLKFNQLIGFCLQCR
jgi:hypothetical protein